jgi:hypothetical protein
MPRLHVQVKAEEVLPQNVPALVQPLHNRPQNVPKERKPSQETLVRRGAAGFAPVPMGKVSDDINDGLDPIKSQPSQKQAYPVPESGGAKGDFGSTSMAVQALLEQLRLERKRADAMEAKFLLARGELDTIRDQKHKLELELVKVQAAAEAARKGEKAAQEATARAAAEADRAVQLIKVVADSGHPV